MRKFRCIKKDKFKNDFLLKESAFIGEDEKYHFLYRIDFPNGKYYLGKHTTKKINDGYGGSGVLLPREYAYNDINKTTKTIISFFKNVEDLDNAEEILIGDLFKSDENCLNYKRGGNGGVNEIARNKISNSKKGVKRSEESIEKQRQKCIGKKHSEETKQKQSEWHNNFWTSLEGIERRKKMSEIMTGRNKSESTKERLSFIVKERFSNKTYRLKSRLKLYQRDFENIGMLDTYEEIMKKDFLSDEEYEIIKDKLDFFKKERRKRRYDIKNKDRKKYIFTEEHKKRISESRKGKKASLETKQKFSNMRRGRNNSNYCNDTIFMFNSVTNKIEKEFYDCIEAVEYIKKYINPKARGSEIFIACRTGRVRYNYKWKQKQK